MFQGYYVRNVGRAGKKGSNCFYVKKINCKRTNVQQSAV